LVLSAFTHIWNPVGFPTLRPDEGAYMRRAMHVLEGLGPQDPASRFDHSQDSTSSYDHPYFGQLFLAGVLKLIGYPTSVLNPSGSSLSFSSSSSSSSSSSASLNSLQHSIEMLYLVPRVLMGILSIIDTFLVYKIADRRYNRSVALIASVLFAVMPMTWILRLIVLDSIQLPFLLCSILFAIYYPIKKTDFAKNNGKNNDDAINKKNILLILLSGVFLGLAIFTKLPAVTMVPVVGFLIYQNNNSNNNKLKLLGLWFIPVILIPLIWPIYSISVGQFNQWINGVIWQGTERHGGKTLYDVLLSFFRIDPVLVVLGLAGLVVFPAVAVITTSAAAAAASTIKNKDFLFLPLWLFPYLLLIYFIGWAIIFYLIPILPVFCIAAARVIEYLMKRIIRSSRRFNEEKKEREDAQKNIVYKKSSLSLLPSLAVTSVIVIFGLLTSTILITTNISPPQFEAAAFVVYDTQHNNNRYTGNNTKSDDDITIISSPIYSWTFDYIFHRSHVFSHDRDTQPIQTKKVILIVDGTYKRVLSKIEGEDEKQVKRLEMLYNSTDTIATYDDDTTRYEHNNNYYPYASMSENRIGGGGIEIKANY
jgi:Dolichyl-phosphate-mannose-protein mannosyltransferase